MYIIYDMHIFVKRFFENILKNFALYFKGKFRYFSSLPPTIRASCESMLLRASTVTSPTLPKIFSMYSSSFKRRSVAFSSMSLAVLSRDRKSVV